MVNGYNSSYSAAIQTQKVLKNIVLKFVKGNRKTEYAHITSLCNYDCLVWVIVKKSKLSPYAHINRKICKKSRGLYKCILWLPIVVQKRINNTPASLGYGIKPQ